MTYPPLLRALNSRNYRLFFTGQGVSLIGNWMTNTASAWLAYELTHSVFAVGFLTFANQIPILVLGPVGGVLGDRMDRRKIMIAMQVVCMVLSAAMAVVVGLDKLTFSLLLAVASIRGMVNALEFPTRQSFIVALVERKDDLPNAIAMNSSLFNVARLIGPGMAGALIALAGPAWCFALDSVSFIAALLALAAIRVSGSPKARAKGPWGEMRDGLAHVRGRPGLLAPLLIVPVVAFSGFASTILAPVFARDVFGGDARSLGWMLSAMGAGALSSALLLGSRKDTVGLESWVWQGAVLTGLSLAGFAFSCNLQVALLFLVLNGMGVVLCMAGSNTLLQSKVEDSMRGRVMGLFVMGQGMYPIGSLVAGSIASGLGAAGAVLCMAAVALAAGLAFRRFSRRAQPASS